MGLADTLGRAIEAVRVNRTWRDTRQGRPVLCKQRRPLASGLIPGGNTFLRLSRSRIHMFTSVEAWIAHELHGFSLLHGPDRVCGREGPRGLYVELLPGASLRELAEAGDLGPRELRAAAAELRRAHCLYSEALGGPFSHGDLHLDNVRVDRAAGRAWLVDFETRHDAGLSAVERHADDLLVLALELMGRAEGWEALVAALLETYGGGETVEALTQRLHAPRGLEAVLWSIRAGHMPEAALNDRVQALRAVVEEAQST